jgi:hypothetical protein
VLLAAPTTAAPFAVLAMQVQTSTTTNQPLRMQRPRGQPFRHFHTIFFFSQAMAAAASAAQKQESSGHVRTVAKHLLAHLNLTFGGTQGATENPLLATVLILDGKVGANARLFLFFSS